MNKKILIGILIFVLLILGFAGYIIYYFILYTPPNQNTRIIQNPIKNFTDEQAIKQFNETFVLYLLASIGAQNLHNPPLSSDTPKIEIHVDSDVYNAEIIQGSINVQRGSITNKDIIIYITKQEGVKMLRNRNEVINSFNQGRSSLQMVASQTSLALKGYLGIYQQLTGKEA